MKSLRNYILEAKESFKLNGMIGYGSKYPVADFVITGAGSDASKETYLKDLIKNAEFTPEAVQNALNSDGCTYDSWEGDEKNCTKDKITLRTKDSNGNLLTLTVYKK